MRKVGSMSGNIRQAKKGKRFKGRRRGTAEEGGRSKGRQEEESTSIFRPSTIVPFSFSRAWSASALVSNVTNPKPCSGQEVGLKNQATKEGRPEVR